ncbi:response regulator [Thiomicrospira sp. WB1]|uniref:response regulator n=1 Tax=Thiomicrospira sp. WB1 TaxID=1685380 RepID=UPI0007493C12|nr:response regulator [Thiomicrospira sp. WB1]KUJ72856.1 two-component system response regulator [Thiomicrospira sp. WB1]
MTERHHAPCILIVEDEAKIADIVQAYLENEGFKTHQLNRGDEVEPWLEANSADLMILDLMLPGKDGIAVCKAVRAFSRIPIMMLTAKVEEVDRVIGLETGADDYLCKPFSPKEVVARVKALLRRRYEYDLQTHVADWQMDEERYQVHYQGQHVNLSVVEFAILKQLSQSPGRIFSRAQLISSIYPDNRVVSDRTVDSHIKKLRHKLFEALTEDDIIHSVYGVGYKFELPEGLTESDVQQISEKS